jgi:hypothetical protein
MSRTYKLVVEFPNPEAALEWAEIAEDTIAGDVEFFEADALDFGGRAESGTFILRRRGDRPEGHSLRALVEAREEAAQAGGEAARRKVRKAR